MSASVPTLTVLVPVYNEAKTVRQIMDALVRCCPDAQIVYVDDGSADDSLTILREHARPQDVVITQTNGGKGSAIRYGLTRAEGAYTVIQDADLEYDPAQIQDLLREAQAHPGCAVFGSRFLQSNPNIYRRFLWGNKVLTGLFNILYASRLTDSYTCLKLIPTGTFQQLGLRANGFELEAEICCKLVKHRIPIREMPIIYRPRSIEEGKKIRFSDAWRGAVTMVRLRFRKH